MCYPQAYMEAFHLGRNPPSFKHNSAGWNGGSSWDVAPFRPAKPMTQNPAPCSLMSCHGSHGRTIGCHIGVGTETKKTATGLISRMIYSTILYMYSIHIYIYIHNVYIYTYTYTYIYIRYIYIHIHIWYTHIYNCPWSLECFNSLPAKRPRKATGRSSRQVFVLSRLTPVAPSLHLKIPLESRRFLLASNHF